MDRLVEELYAFKGKVEDCENDYIISVQEKLREYEDLDERIGVPLEELAKLCDKHIPKDCQNPNKAIVLTDEDVDRWNEYKNAEEQGLLLRLPCKIGDTIYEVSYENREFVIKEHIVKEFIYRTYRFLRIEIYCENENGFLVCNNIGKLDECLFLTQAEAEQKLKEMESD